MQLSRISRSEIIAICGGALLAVAVFLAWYHLRSNLVTLAGHRGKGSNISGWDAHPTALRYLLLAGAAAPLILAWIVIRGHALSWPRGEVTAVVAITAFGLVFYNGIISRPGDPSSEVGLQYGFYIALVATLLMLAGAVSRASETGRTRKPPGTI